MARLDRTRDYGTILRGGNVAGYSQDGIDFNPQGESIEVVHVPELFAFNPDNASRDELLEWAASKGLEVDKRWNVRRIKEEVKRHV